MLHIFIVETNDDNFFTTTFASGTNLGKRKANQIDSLFKQIISEPIATESNQFCTECGNKIYPGTKFCGKCGKQLN